MKKWITSAFALLMVAVMMLTMASCGNAGNKVDITGTWEADLDFSAMMKQASEQDESLAGLNLDFELSKVKMVFTFGEDETMSMKIDADSMTVMLKDYMEKIFGQVIESAGMNMSVDEYLQLAGMSMDDMIDSMIAEEDAFKQLEEVGTYKIEGQKLYLVGEDETFDENVYTPFSFDGETLVLNTPVGETYTDEAEQSMVEILFPMTLKKAA